MAYNNVTNKIKICKKEKKLTGQFSFYKQFDFKVPSKYSGKFIFFISYKSSTLKTKN